MHRFILVILTGFFFSQTLLAQSFEGVITISVKSELTGDNTNINWYKKGANHRLEVTSITKEMTTNFVLLYLANDPNMYMLTDVGGEKTAYKVPLSKMTTPKDLSLGGGIPLETKKEEIVSGFTCRIVEAEGASAQAKYWLSNDFKLPLADFAPLFQTPNYFKFLLRKGIQGVPIKIESSDLDGQVQYRQTLKSLKAEKLNDALFGVPSDYTVKN